MKLRTALGGILTLTLGLGFLAASVFLTGPAAHASTAATKTITLTHGGGLDAQPVKCGTGAQEEAMFVINQITNAATNAPKQITVTFSDGSSATYPLTAVTKSNAHYQGPVPAGAKVTGASAVIYQGWSGSFVLSHYTCGSTTPTTPPPATDPTTTTTTVAHGHGHGTTTTTTTVGLGSGHGTTTTTKKAGTATAAKPAASDPSASTPQLAFTGSRTEDLAWLGFGLIGVGLLLTAVRRRPADQ